MKKVLQRNVGKLSLAALFAAGSMSANAFEIENDGWTFSLHGNVNTHYIYNSCDDSAEAAGAAPFALLCSGDTDPSAISNGYLPTTFEFALATQRAGYDISVHSAFDRGLDQNQAFNGAGDGEGFRIWMTVGNEDIGSVLLGRSWGLFGYDATFQDMSVFAVGGPFGTASPSNTTLGAAGTGYIFLDRITQATWTLPTSDAWVVQIGLYQPLDLWDGSNNVGNSGATTTSGEAPGMHGRLRYNFDKGFVSVSGLVQDVDGQAIFAVGESDFTAKAYDVTGQLNFGNLSLTGTYFMSDGAGHTGLFIDAVNSSDGSAKETDGWLAQAVYTAGSTRYGLNYGETNVDNVSGALGFELEEKTKITAGVYHSLASGITIAAEFSKVEAEDVSGAEIENDVASIGAIFFF